MKHIKLVLVGDQGSGKSCALARVMGTFKQDKLPESTEFLDYAVKELPERKAKVVLWDTAGGEEYRSTVPRLYRGADVFVIFFDLQAHQTVESISQAVSPWYESIRQYDGSRPLYLVGSKTDLLSEEQMVSIKNVLRTVSITLGLRTFVSGAYRNTGIQLDTLINLTVDASALSKPILSAVAADKCMAAADSLSKMINGTIDCAILEHILKTASDWKVSGTLSRLHRLVRHKKGPINGADILECVSQKQQKQLSAWLMDVDRDPVSDTTVRSVIRSIYRNMTPLKAAATSDMVTVPPSHSVGLAQPTTPARRPMASFDIDLSAAVAPSVG